MLNRWLQNIEQICSVVAVNTRKGAVAPYPFAGLGPQTG